MNDNDSKKFDFLLFSFHNPKDEIIKGYDVVPQLSDDIQLTVDEYRNKLYQFIQTKNMNSGAFNSRTRTASVGSGNSQTNKKVTHAVDSENELNGMDSSMNYYSALGDRKPGNSSTDKNNNYYEAKKLAEHYDQANKRKPLNENSSNYNYASSASNQNLVQNGQYGGVASYTGA